MGAQSLGCCQLARRNRTAATIRAEPAPLPSAFHECTGVTKALWFPFRRPASRSDILPQPARARPYARMIYSSSVSVIWDEALRGLLEEGPCQKYVHHNEVAYSCCQWAQDKLKALRCQPQDFLVASYHCATPRRPQVWNKALEKLLPLPDWPCHYTCGSKQRYE